MYNFKEYLEKIRQQENEESTADNSLLQPLNEEVKEEKSINEGEIALDFENLYQNNVDVNSIECKSSNDGLILSLTNLAKVDIEYISKVTQKPYEEIISDLKGSIFQNPNTWEETLYKGWETKEEYLSGNLRNKFLDAEKANKKYPGVFEENLKAIQKITNNSSSISIDQIYFTLGSPWIPEDIICKFVCYILDVENDEIDIIHDKTSGTWTIKLVNSVFKKYIRYDKYGTKRINAIDLIEKTLNQSPIVITDPVPYTKNQRSKNDKETLAALVKQKQLLNTFKEWVLKDEKLKTDIENKYNETFCQNYRRYFSGEHFTFPGINIQLFDYQKNAAARIIFSKNTLLAHDVGSGKTYVMIAAGQELRRMGISKKNLYVISNDIIFQWERIYKEMYPSTSLLIVDKRNFTPQKMQETLKRIRDEEFDAILMTYSCFNKLTLSPDYYKDDLYEKLESCDETLKNTSSNTSYVNLSAKKFKNDYTGNLIKIGNRKEDVIYFDDLKIDRLFVDEAHNFKNVSISTTIQALGIRTEGSKKCDNMMDKVKYIQKNHDGGGVIFATGTPITNSITDIYVIQKYLQEGELEMLGLSSFNAWIANFAEAQETFEVDVDTSTYRMATRYSKFHNIPELASILTSIVDFYHVDKDKELPIFEGYTDIVSSPTPEFEAFLKDISSRADEVRSHKPREFVDKISQNTGEPVKDNMLLITNDGRKAALDIRLFDSKNRFDEEYKVYKCAEKVYEIYQKTSHFNGTQLIFCDTSTPKTTFNVYDEIKTLLIQMGVPSHEIEFIQSYTSKTKKESLLKKVRLGEVRVLIGSTFKLGTGVNVQDRLYAIHHLDVPWRPSDIIQREGRIMRLGNTNEQIYIYRYIMKNSFDAYSWQLLETKQTFISRLLNDSIFTRDANDIDDIALNYAEVKALAIGNPMIKIRVETYNELQNLKKLQYQKRESDEQLRIRLCGLQTSLPSWKEDLIDLEDDLNHFKSQENFEMDDESKRVFRETIYNKLIENANLNKEDEIGTFLSFSLVSPAFQPQGSDNLILYIKRKKRYIARVGNSPLHIMRGINLCLSSLQKNYDELKNKIASTEKFIIDAELELNKEDEYIDKIRQKEEYLANIDNQLGIKKGA